MTEIIKKYLKTLKNHQNTVLLKTKVNKKCNTSKSKIKEK